MLHSQLYINRAGKKDSVDIKKSEEQRKRIKNCDTVEKKRRN